MQKLVGNLREAVAAFWQWWVGELAALIPQRVSRLFEQRTEALVVSLTRDEVVATRQSGRAVRPVGRLALVEAQALPPDAVRKQLIGGSLPKGLDIVLRLRAEQVLYKTLELPLAAESTLRQTLTFAVDSQTPFRADAVLFDFRVTARDRAAKRLSVEWTIVPRAIVDTTLSLMSGWSMQPTVVDVERPVGAWPSLNFLPSAETARPRLLRRATVALATAAAGLAVAVVWLPIHQRQEVLDGLKVEITAAKRAADSTAKLRAESERLIEEGRFLADRKRQAPSPLRTLEELSRLLPDDTWLVEFSISGGQGRMAGFSAAASKLIPLIEDSNGFRNARFRSPVTPTPTGDSERFDLAFDLQTEARE